VKLGERKVGLEAQGTVWLKYCEKNYENRIIIM